MYPESQRRIFRYRIGNQFFYADPIHTLRLLKMACRGRLGQLTAAHNVYAGFPPEGVPESEWATFKPTPAPEGSPEYMAGLDARGEIAQATIKAFGLPVFNGETGEGTLEEEAIALFVEFQRFLAEKKA